MCRAPGLDDDEGICVQVCPTSDLQSRKRAALCCPDSDVRLCVLNGQWGRKLVELQGPSSDFMVPHPELWGLALKVIIKANRDVSIETLTKTGVTFASAKGACVWKADVLSQWFSSDQPVPHRGLALAYDTSAEWLIGRKKCASLHTYIVFLLLKRKKLTW